MDGIKKEQLEFGGPATSRASPAQSGGSEKCLTPKTSSTPTPQVISQTPPLRQPPSSPHSAINLISPGSSTGSIGGSATPSHSAVSLPAPHPAQPHASYPGSMPPPHLMHPPFLHVSFHIKKSGGIGTKHYNYIQTCLIAVSWSSRVSTVSVRSLSLSLSSSSASCHSSTYVESGDGWTTKEYRYGT